MTRRSPLALIVLALLAEEPMHPYRMQQLVKERGKDRVVNVAQRNSVYQTIDRLVRDGLVRARETARDERRPERTVYEITPAGTRTVAGWVRDMLAAPAREFPEFPAALSSVMLLGPAEVAGLLAARVAVLDAVLAEHRAALAGAVSAGIPRLFLLEDEYQVAAAVAERAWTQSIVDELVAGGLTWDLGWLRRFSGQALAGWPDQ